MCEGRREGGIETQQLCLRKKDNYVSVCVCVCLCVCVCVEAPPPSPPPPTSFALSLFLSMVNLSSVDLKLLLCTQSPSQSG